MAARERSGGIPEIAPSFFLQVVEGTSLTSDDARLMRLGRIVDDLADQSRVLLEFARACERMGEPIFALPEALDRIVRLAPGHALGYLYRGIVKTRLGLYRGAVEDFSSFVERNPASAAGLNNRGVAFAREKECARAIEDFGSAIQARGDRAEPYHNRGTVLGLLGEWERAAKDLQEAVRRAPNAPITRRNYGVALYKQKSYRQALSEFNRILAMTPQDVMTRFYAAECYAQTEDVEQSAKQRAQAANGAARIVDSHMRLADHLERQGELAAAHDELASALRLSRQWGLGVLGAQCHYRIGMIHLFGGRPGEAEAHLHLSAAILVASPTAFAGRGLARLRQGNKVGALADFRTALRLGKGTWPLKEVVEQVGRKVETLTAVPASTHG